MTAQLNPLRTGTLTLILGGVRSGKSHFGQSLAQALGGDDVLFVATAEARDSEMARRIELHQQSRPASWRTLEQTTNIGDALTAISDLPTVVLLDCLTLLVSNVLLDSCDELADPKLTESRLRMEVDSLCSLSDQRNGHLIVVSGEVGMGVVPESKMGRVFRDLLGWANQSFAARADATYLMIAGRAVNVAAIATDVSTAALDLSHHAATGRETRS